MKSQAQNNKFWGMKQLLDSSKGAKPLYIQIKEIIYAAIAEGRWQPGDLIPTEVELMKRYSVSRMTIRQATNELVMENILIRKSGVGTRVLRPPLSDDRFSTIVKSFSNELKEARRSPQTFYIKLNRIEANEPLRQIFGEELKAKQLFRLDRVRGYDGKKIVYFQTYLCTNVDLSQIPIDEDFSLYGFFEQSGVPLKTFEEKITATLADTELSNYLNVSVNDAILLRERFAADPDGVLTEYSLGYYDSSKYAYRIVL